MLVPLFGWAALATNPWEPLGRTLSASTGLRPPFEGSSGYAAGQRPDGAELNESLLWALNGSYLGARLAGTTQKRGVLGAQMVSLLWGPMWDHLPGPDWRAPLSAS